jgi:hypothetical protein
MKRHSGFGSWNLARAAFPLPPTVHRRKARPCLEALERREVLSTFTWNGNAGDGNWDNGANWAGGSAPTSGTVDIVLPNPTSPQTITLHPDDAGLVFNSITVQGGSYTLQGPIENAVQPVVLAAGASLNTQNGSSLAICPDRLASPDANSLSLTFLGGTTKTGTGTLLLNTDLAKYPASPAPLQPFHISGGTVTLGAHANMYQSLLQVDTGTRLVVSEGFNPTVGSLSGGGTIQIGVNPGQAGSTGLNIYTPQGESDVFNGVINGQGGTISMIGAGSITLGSVNPNQTGLFSVTCGLGSLLVNGVLNAQQLHVSSGATFGGPAMMSFSGVVKFFSGATFAAVADGAAAGQFTQFTDTDTSDPTPVDLGGSTLSLSLGYTPANGDSYTIISAAKVITGQFANAANGQTITVNGFPYKVNASGTTVTLAVPSPTPTPTTPTPTPTTPTPTPTTPTPTPTTPTIQSEQIELVYLKHNKKGKPIGKPVVDIAFTFSIPMNPGTAGSTSNYQVAWISTKKVGKKLVPVVHPIGVLSVTPDSSDKVFTVATNATQKTFAKGGQVVVIGGVSSRAGVSLGGNQTFTIGAKASSIS